MCLVPSREDPQDHAWSKPLAGKQARPRGRRHRSPGRDVPPDQPPRGQRRGRVPTPYRTRKWPRTRSTTTGSWCTATASPEPSAIITRPTPSTASPSTRTGIEGLMGTHHPDWRRMGHRQGPRRDHERRPTRPGAAWPDGVALIGVTSHRGSVMAVEAWDAPECLPPMPPAVRDPRRRAAPHATGASRLAFNDDRSGPWLSDRCAGFRNRGRPV